MDTRPPNRAGPAGPQPRRPTRSTQLKTPARTGAENAVDHDLGALEKRAAPLGKSIGYSRPGHTPTTPPQTATGHDGTTSADELRRAESAPQNSLYNNGEGSQSAPQKRFRTKLNWRRQRTSLFVGGSIIAFTIGFFTFTITPQLKIPSIIGNIRISLPSSLIARQIAEAAFKRVLMNYLISKAAGDLDAQAKPGSALRGLHNAFDNADVVGKMGRQNSIEFRKIDGDVHFFFKGEDQGVANTYKELTELTEKNRLAARSVNGAVRYTLPIFRFLDLSFVRYVRATFFNSKFGTPAYDESKSKQENIDNLNKHAAEVVLREPTSVLGDALGCALGAEGDTGADPCDTFERVEDKSPIDTADPSISRRLTPTSGELDNATAEATKDLITESVDEALQGEPKNGSYLERTTEIISGKIIRVATSATFSTALPLVGPIDALAQIQHAIGVAYSQHLVARTSILMKEQAYGSLAALWLGYADEIKDGNMKLSYVDALNDQITGHNFSSMAILLAGGDPSKGLQVQPTVGNDLDDPIGDFSDFAYNKIGLAWRLPLEAWYYTISQALGAFSELAGKITGFVLSPFTSVWERALTAIFGPNWMQEFALFGIKAIMFIFGISIDPNAKGGTLVNGIGTGMDVMNNRYLQTNLGAREVTTRETPELVMRANQNYQDGLAALPLTERLFSLDVPSSLASRAVQYAPTSTDPGSLAASILSPIKGIPGMFVSLLSGRSWAAASQQQVTDLNGVAQFGGSPEEIDADIPQEVKEPGIPQCPPNADGFFNNCQRYKEILGAAMCIHTNCPQAIDN